MVATKSHPWERLLTPEFLARLDAQTQRGAASECWLWQGSTAGDYGILRGRTAPQRRIGVQASVRVRVTRAVFARHHGEAATNAAEAIRHTCDNPLCVNPAHLQAGTHSDNAQDREKRGRANRLAGASHPNSKLTPEAVAEIRRAVASGEPERVLAERFGVDRATIGYVARRESWRHVL